MYYAYVKQIPPLHYIVPRSYYGSMYIVLGFLFGFEVNYVGV